MRLVALFFILVGGSHTGLARLGESVEELSKRFGKPVKEEDLKQVALLQKTYTNKDLVIGVTFSEGKSVSEQYMRTKASEG